MNSIFGERRIFDRLFSRNRVPQQRRVHWLDTTPVKSSDKPCELARLDVQARVLGIFAEVTQTLEIKNPNPRALSVGITIPLPDRATVCGYALDIDGTMVDGVVVPKEQARVVFETEQRRGVDPGLVEAVKGNVYNTRVYPVPAHGTRTVRLRYVTPLLLGTDGSTTLHLSMPGEQLAQRTTHIDVETLDSTLPVIEGLQGTVVSLAQSNWSATAEERDVAPEADIRVTLPALPTSFTLLERDSEGTIWFTTCEKNAPAAPATDEAPTDQHGPFAALTVLWDASGSRAGEDHAPELELLRAYCADGPERINLIVFGDSAHKAVACASADELVQHIQAVHYDGGTNLAALVDALAEQDAQTNTDQLSACVLFTDGLDTLSDDVLTFPSTLNIAAIVSGTQRDVEAMRQACGGLAFDPALAPKDAAALARMFDRNSTNRTLRINGSGIADVCDASAPAGGWKAAIGRLTAEQTTIELGEGGTTFELSAANARTGNVLAGAWASRRVAQLAPRATDNANELLSIGRRFGVVSPVTSLLVLESLDQWLRYDIEPPATLPEMRNAWRRAQEGKMNLTSDQARTDAHRRNLGHQWSELMEWWATDFKARLEANAGGRICPMCGARVPDTSPYCMQCGSRMPFNSNSSEDIPIRSAPDWGDGGAEGLPQELIDEAYAMPDSAPMRTEACAPAFLGAAMAAESAPRALGRRGIPTEAASMMMAVEGGEEGFAEPSEQNEPSLSVSVRAWMPDASYLKALDKAFEKTQTAAADPKSDEAAAAALEAAHDAYYAQRAEYSTSPSFFLDCAGWFVAHDDVEFGARVLSNLAELRIEDAALLRVMGWRLREMGRLEQALGVLRRVLKLRTEDSQSHRDVALVLTELARQASENGDEAAARAYAEEAGDIYRFVALKPWDRRPMAIGLFAVEEYNILRAWAEAQTWETAPSLPSLGEEFEGVPACDLRITLAWDADETDVDIHVTEPSGEEAYYAHNLTYSGGRVSEDITDGYGPELYEIRHAETGIYNIRAHYYASHQQTIFGPATCTLTVYTNWGRPEQTQQITTTRLENAKEMIPVGIAAFGVDPAEVEQAAEAEDPVKSVQAGMSESEVVALLGEPAEPSPFEGQSPWFFELAGGRKLEVMFDGGKVVRISELMPWGEQMILAQS